MSSVRTAKRAVESILGRKIEFRVHCDRETDAPVEVHLLTSGPDRPTYLGAGSTHHEAISDACDGLRELARQYQTRSRRSMRQLEEFS